MMLRLKVASWLANRGVFIAAVKFKYRKQTIKFRLDGWVVISDGHATDALPISLCSPELADEIAFRLGANHDH